MDTNGGTALRAASMRRVNLSTVLDVVRFGGAVSRSGLVASTGLTRSAIAGIVGELERIGLVVEDAAVSDGRPGRPSLVVRVDPDRVGVLAIEIGVDEIGAAVVALDGRVLHSRRAVRPRNRVPVGETVTDVVALVRSLVDGPATSDGRRLLGVGIAVAGLVDEGAGNVVVAPNLGWRDVAIGERLRRALGTTVAGLRIVVGNDGDLGGLAESRFGAAVGAPHMVYANAEVGVGGGLFVGGRRIVGRSGFAGEIGHVPLDPNGEPCACGSIGCWETVVGERAFLRRAGRDPDGGGRGVAEIVASALAGDPRAIEAVDDEATWLGVGVAGLVNVFDPDVVVLDGIFARVLEVAGERFAEELAARAFRGLGREVPVVAGRLGADSRLVGAAELVLESVLSDPLALA